MAINGYTDKMSVQPGQKIKFMVNSESDRYTTEIVKLIHGDTDPKAPEFKVEKITADVNKEYKGKQQEIHMGSYVKVDEQPVLANMKSFSLQSMICPTTVDKGPQAILSKWSFEEQSGYGLFLDENGCLSLWIGDSNGNREKLTSNKPLLEGSWFLVGASYDESNGKMSIFQEAFITKTNGRFSLLYDLDDVNDRLEKNTTLKPHIDNNSPFVMASVLKKQQYDKYIPMYKYNGKIDRPRLANKVLNQEEMSNQIENPNHNSIVAAWDFSNGITKHGIKDIDKIIDTSENKLHGVAFNSPMRAVTGYNWTSEELKFVHAPKQYGAIHFHDDDLTDANWDVDFEWQIPDSLASGVYAAHVQGEGQDEEDYLVFFVRPKKGQPTAKTALIIPTASYLAYANNRFQDVPVAQLMFGRAPVVQQEDIYLGEHAEYGLSTYDYHNDGSGVCFSSSQRPILNMRPKYRHNLSPSLWQFNADLQLVDWLTEKGFDFDIITDHDLHFEGAELLNDYRVVITGSHPEYYSGNMLDGVADFQENGGRFMYMGANGFYWVVNFHPENPNIMEVRKNFGNNAWKGAPGEDHLSVSGEFSTIWKLRNRAPQKIAGTGFVAQGFEESTYYRRSPQSLDSKFSWMFEGIGEDEKLGDFGLVGDGAAGLELDAFSHERGTPPHATIVASSEDHSAVYMPVTEELHFNIPGLAGDENPGVRADIVYYPTPNGGGVFSTSSISYCGSLSHNNYNNNISQLTENVLKRFLADEPLS